MINDKYTDMKKVAALFDALGHYRRIMIFNALQQYGVEGMNFGDLAQTTKISEANLTHHIRMMKKGGIVSSRIVGRYTKLSLNTHVLTSSLELLHLDGDSVRK